jgi:circularly permuted ATPgrasp domain protein
MTTIDPIAAWDALLPDENIPELCARLADRMRARRLHFGGRLLCPFLRPFFLDAADEGRVRHAAETLWMLGERIARVAPDNRALLAQLGLSDAEIRLAAIDPGYETTSTTARADAFVLPDSLQFAEYNGESPAGAGYSQGLAEVFAGEPLMARFREQVDAQMYRPVDRLLDALIASYREWGGTASPPLIAIVDWDDVPTVSEFELLRDAFTLAGVPTIVADPRELTYEAAASGVNRLPAGLYAHGRRIDLVYRRVLINDIVARADECRALLDAYEQRAVCVANSLRCKIPHKKAFFAVLTDARHAHLFSDGEHHVIRQHVPWTVLIEDGRVARDGQSIDLLELLRRHRERFVVKPNDEYGGTGVVLGWETSAAEWDAVLERAVSDHGNRWVAQERIAVRREPFPVCENGALVLRDMLVDFAPYVFRGRLAGFLTRLSASGLANVTSGGGQVPAFVIRHGERHGPGTYNGP